jgi:hypothetical protein
MFDIHAVAHRNGDGTGDPKRHCEELTLRASDWSEAPRIAQLNRMNSDPRMQQRLFELMDQVEAEFAEVTQLVGC